MSDVRASSSGWPTFVAQHTINYCLAVKPNEQVLILADTEADHNLVDALAACANIAGAEPTIMIMPPAFKTPERYIPKLVLRAMEITDIYITVTPTTGLTVHSEEVAKLRLGKKMRSFLFGWHGGGVLDAVEAIRSHDFEKLYKFGREVAQVMTDGETVHLTSDAGSDLTASIKGFRYKHPAALARLPGELGYYTAGEAGGGPIEGTANGVIVVDGSIQNVCDKPFGADPPVKLYVEKGKIVRVEGGAEAEILRDVINRIEGADNLAELSVGINPYVRLTGKTSVTDKNAYGTIHVAIGENVFQIYPLGTVRSPIHWDMIIRKPTLKVDSKVLVEKGKIVGVKF